MTVSRRTIVSLLSPVLLALAASACGGESEAQKAKDKGADAASAEICDASPLAGATGLPPGFPKPGGITYRRSTSAGPSKIVDATYAGSLDDAYDAYRTAVTNAGYDVLFKE